MPFKSEAQRRYLHANNPKLAKEWEQKYNELMRVQETYIKRLHALEKGEQQ